MLKSDRHMVQRELCARPLGPFDENERLTADDVIPADVRQLVGTTQSIEIEMKHWRSRRDILMNDGEGRARNLFLHAVPTTDRPRQRGLACSKLPTERDYKRGLRCSPQPFAPRHQLRLREREPPPPSERRHDWRVLLHVAARRSAPGSRAVCGRTRGLC